MSDLLFSAARKAAVLAAPPLLAFAMWLVALAPLRDLHRALDEEAERSQALLQRYRAVAAQEGEVKAALLRLQADSGNQDLFHGTANANAAATLLQQRLGELVAATGGQIRAARVEIKPKTPNYQPFAVNLTFVASTAGLATLLFQMEALRPIVFVDSVAIHASPALLNLQNDANAPDRDKLAAEDQVLDVALTVSALAVPKG